MSTYNVIVKLEDDFRSEDGLKGSGPQWVARDLSGTWRSYCDGSLATDPIAAIVAMFHPVEIVRIVRIDNSKARAVIEGS